MRSRFGRLFGLLCCLVLLAACATEDCDICPGGVFVNVEAGEQPSDARVRFCLVELARCTTEAYSHDSMFLDLPKSLTPEELDGQAMEISLLASQSGGGKVRSKTVRLRYHDGGHGQCACSFTSAAVSFRPGSSKTAG